MELGSHGVYPVSALCQAADLAHCSKPFFPKEFKFINQMESELMKLQDDTSMCWVPQKVVDHLFLFLHAHERLKEMTELCICVRKERTQL